MNITYKLAVPLLAGLILSMLLIQFDWQSYQLADDKLKYKQHTRHMLDVARPSLVKYLLERDLGALYSELKQLETSQKNIWLNMTFHNEDNKRLYPVFKEDIKKLSEKTDLIYIVYPLRIEGTNLGHLEFYVNWEKDKLTIIENLNDTRDTMIWIMIWIVFMVLLLITLSHYQTLYKPLKKLDAAVNKVKHRD